MDLARLGSRFRCALVMTILLTRICIVRLETKQRPCSGAGNPLCHAPIPLVLLRQGTAPLPFSPAVDLHRAEDGATTTRASDVLCRQGAGPSSPLSYRPTLPSPLHVPSLCALCLLLLGLTSLSLGSLCLFGKDGSPSLAPRRVTLGRPASSTVVLT